MDNESRARPIDFENVVGKNANTSNAVNPDPILWKKKQRGEKRGTGVAVKGIDFRSFR